MSKKNLIKLARITVPARNELYRITVDKYGYVRKNIVHTKNIISRIHSRNDEEHFENIERLITANPFDVYVLFYDQNFEKKLKSEVFLYKNFTNTYDPSGMDYDDFVNSNIGIKYINAMKNYRGYIRIDEVELDNCDIVLKRGNDFITMTKFDFVPTYCKTMIPVKTSNGNILSEFNYANYLSISFSHHYGVKSFVPLPINTMLLTIHEKKDCFPIGTVTAFVNGKHQFTFKNLDNINNSFIMQSAISCEELNKWSMDDDKIEIFFAEGID